MRFPSLPTVTSRAPSEAHSPDASLPRFHRPRLSLNSAYMLLLLLTGLISVVVMDYNSKESVCQAVAMLRIRSIISFFLTFPLFRGARRIFRNPFRAARIFCPVHGAPEEDGKWPFGSESPPCFAPGNQESTSPGRRKTPELRFGRFQMSSNENFACIFARRRV